MFGFECYTGVEDERCFLEYKNGVESHILNLGKKASKPE